MASVSALILAVTHNIISFDVDKEQEISILAENYGEGPSPDNIQLKYQVGEEEDDKGHIIFYASHALVSAYIDGELIYEIYPGEKSPIKTPIGRWHTIRVKDAYAGQELLIDIKHVHGYHMQPVTFYYGNELSIVGMGQSIDWLVTLIALLTVCLGVGMLFYQWINSKHKNDTIKYLSWCSIAIGVWRFSDQVGYTNLAVNSTYVYLLIFMSFMMIPILFHLFIGNRYQIVATKLWQANYIVSYVLIVTQLVLQLFGIRDFSQTLPMTHFNLIIVGCAALYHTYQIVRNPSIRKAYRRDCCAIVLFVVCGVYAVLGYTFNQYSSILPSASYFIYLAMVGLEIVKENQKNIERMKEVEVYHRLAYTDSLTGLANRAAYQRDINHYNELLLTQSNMSQTGVVAVMFDMNDLKGCNDLLGHHYGDEYICTVGRTIQDVFHDKKYTYRIGGDEFCVLVPDMDAKELSQKIKLFEQAIEVANKLTQNYQVSVAVGYALFDAASDRTLEDTIKRADSAMYTCKIAMKKQARCMNSSSMDTLAL